MGQPRSPGRGGSCHRHRQDDGRRGRRAGAAPAVGARPSCSCPPRSSSSSGWRAFGVAACRQPRSAARRRCHRLADHPRRGRGHRQHAAVERCPAHPTRTACSWPTSATGTRRHSTGWRSTRGSTGGWGSAPPTPETTTATSRGSTRTSAAAATNWATGAPSPTGSPLASQWRWSACASSPCEQNRYDELTEAIAGRIGGSSSGTAWHTSPTPRSSARSMRLADRPDATNRRSSPASTGWPSWSGGDSSPKPPASGTCSMSWRRRCVPPTVSIVFTQSIAASEDVARRLSGSGVSAGAVHSGLARRRDARFFTRSPREASPVVSAPKSSTRVSTCPAADLAVIVGASRSRRQMIQRMGRVLRRKVDGRLARFAVLFVEGTSRGPCCRRPRRLL